MNFLPRTSDKLSSFSIFQASDRSAKLKGGTPVVGAGDKDKARDKHTDKTTRLLIGILVLFLIAEFPQVGRSPICWISVV